MSFPVYRSLIFNYDGTLVPLSEDPQSPEPSDDLLVLLKEIKEQPGTDIVILSGRSREELERWIGNININLAAEQGSWVREHDSDRWIQLKPLSGEWKEDILPILEIYTDRLPGARIMEKDYSIRWHYHKSDIVQARYIVRELTAQLISITANMGIQIFQGNRSLEISNSGINKGDLARYWLDGKNYDFILAIGAGWSDELLFRSLPENSYSIRIGTVRTNARYVIKDQADVMGILKKLK